MAEFVNKGRYNSIIVHVLENGRNRNLTFQKYWEHVRWCPILSSRLWTINYYQYF